MGGLLPAMTHRRRDLDLYRPRHLRRPEDPEGTQTTYTFDAYERLQDRLGSADAAATDQLAREWTKMRSAAGDPLVEADIVDQLHAVADLARAARAQDGRVYCSGW